MRTHFVVSAKIGKSKISYPIIKALSYLSKYFSKYREFSYDNQSTIMNSRQEALSRGHESIGIEHVFLSILKVANSRAVKILENLNCNIKELKQEIENLIINYPKRKRNNIPFTKQAEKVLRFASTIANEFNSKEIENEHLVLAILKEESSLHQMVHNKFNVSYEIYYNQLKKFNSD